MTQRLLSDAKLEDVKIVFRNMEGREGEYNEKGQRNFSIILEPGIASAMKQDGWNVRERQPKPRDDDPNPDIMLHLPVSVSYKYRAPAIYMITSHGRTHLDETTVGLLDFADIVKVDIILHASPWEKGDKSGYKAYVKTMFVTILEDDLELKYGNVPDIGGPTDEPPWELNND